MDDRFKQAEDEYFVLRGKLQAGRITRAQFEAALRDLIVQDSQGRHWMLGVDSGKWHRHDGQAWVEADPSPLAAQASGAPMRPTDLPEASRQPQPRMTAPPPPASPAPAKKGGVGRCLVTGCLIAVVLVVLLGVGGFLAFRSGAITPNTLLNLAGLGPADIEVDNFRDDAIQVSITRLDASKDSSPSPSLLRLNAFDIKSYRAQDPSRYRVEFRTARGNADLGACALTVRGGDQYQFVALPERIVIHRVNRPSAVGTDFVIQTSALCR